MEKGMKKISMLSGVIIAFVLVMFTVQATNANPVSNQEPVKSLEQGAEMMVVVAHLNIFDGKCGEGTSETKKKTETKTKTSEGKCGEGKCGEGKCGSGTAKTEKSGTAKTEKKTETKEKSAEVKSTSEGKCGEGTSKTEKSTSKKAKTSEGKCGEGKCGVA